MFNYVFSGSVVAAIAGAIIAGVLYGYSLYWRSHYGGGERGVNPLLMYMSRHARQCRAFFYDAK